MDQKLKQYSEDGSGNINWSPGCASGMSPSGSLLDPCQAHHYRVVEEKSSVKEEVSHYQIYQS